MVTLDVKFDDAGTQALLVSLQSRLDRRIHLHNAMAVAVEESVRAHLIEKSAAKSPNTGFYGKASRSVESHATDTAGTVTIPHRGMALRYYGGRVNWDGKIHLALPTKAVPIRGDERLSPREIPNLAYLPAKKSAAPGTTGYLVEGMEKKSAGGKSRMVPKPDGKLMYVLREFTIHLPDPTVLPIESEMAAAAAAAGRDYLAATTRTKRPSK